MYDNKIRISKDVIEKAQMIADEWGLKNPRTALEAVFRKYADEYMYGRLQGSSLAVAGAVSGQIPGTVTSVSVTPASAVLPSVPGNPPPFDSPACEAIDALDDLLAM